MSNTATEDMSRNNANNEQRRKRIKRIKTVILTITLLLLILPSICCVVLSIKMVKLQQQVDRLMIVYNIEEAAEDKGSNIAYAAETPAYEPKVATVDGLLGQVETAREAEAELSGKLQAMNEEKQQKKQDNAASNPSGESMADQTEASGQASQAPEGGSLAVGTASGNANKDANAGADTAVDIESGITQPGDSASYNVVHITDIDGLVWPVPENWLGSGYNPADIYPDNTTDSNAGSAAGSNPDTGSSGNAGGAAGNNPGNAAGSNTGINPGNYPGAPGISPGSNAAGNAVSNTGDRTTGKETDSAARDVQKDKAEEKSFTGRFQGKKVYITFDDGPSIYTDDILDILKEYGVKATFFVVGKTDSFSKEMYKRIVDEGHTLGMHSYSHKYDLIYNSVEDFDKDFTKLWNLLYDTTGLEPKIYRFPGGSANKVNKKGMDEFIKYLNEKSIVYYDWNVLNGDATNIKYTDEQLIDNVLKGVEAKSRSIVLMHDAASKEATVRTLRALLEALIEGGAELYPLDPSVKAIQMIKADSVK